jgi:hypothetical protein
MEADFATWCEAYVADVNLGQRKFVWELCQFVSLQIA